MISSPNAAEVGFLVGEVSRIAGRMGIPRKDFAVQMDFFTDEVDLVVIHPSGVYRHHLLTRWERFVVSEVELRKLLRSRAPEALCPRACDYA